MAEAGCAGLGFGSAGRDDVCDCRVGIMDGWDCSVGIAAAFIVG